MSVVSESEVCIMIVILMVLLLEVIIRKSINLNKVGWERKENTK